MKALQNIPPKHLAIVVVVVVILVVVVYLIGKHSKSNKKKVDVTVDLTDGNGTTIQYDPSKLVEKLDRTLSTTYYWDASERCKVVKELMALPNGAFMATVYGYEKHTGQTLEAAFDACWKKCRTPSLLRSISFGPLLHYINDKMDDFEIVLQRFNILKPTYTAQS